MFEKAQKLMHRMNTKATKVAIGLTAGTSAALAITGIAGATPVTLDEQFSTAQTSVLQELGLGATLLIAVTLFVTGITILVKWLTKGGKKVAG